MIHFASLVSEACLDSRYRVASEISELNDVFALVVVPENYGFGADLLAGIFDAGFDQFRRHLEVPSWNLLPTDAGLELLLKRLGS